MCKTEYKVVIESSEKSSHPQFVEESIEKLFSDDNEIDVSVKEVE